MEVTVSICMITYNHESYIAQAIEGVLMQQTNFQIELVIGDDCSTDNTFRICQTYKDQYQSKIKLLSQKKNLGVRNNFLNTIHNCEGKYIALCEGDDYWIDVLKLQKQVLFLEKNYDYSLIHTNGYRNFGGKLQPWNQWDDLEGEVSKTFYYGTVVRTCSSMFRSSLLPVFFDLFENCKVQIIGDWPLFAYLSTKGKFGYLSEHTCVYRQNPSSVSSSHFKDNFLKYSLDVVNVKRFLRDVLFQGELDELYAESILNEDVIYYNLKHSFDTWNYSNTKLYFSSNYNNIKLKSLVRFTKNHFLFYSACLYRFIIRRLK